MYFVFIFYAVFCKTFLFVKGDYVKVDSVTGKGGLTVKMDGSLDISKLLGFYLRDYPETPDSAMRMGDPIPSSTKPHLRIKNNPTVIKMNTMTMRDPIPSPTKPQLRIKKKPAVIKTTTMTIKNEPAVIKINTMTTSVDVLMTQIEEIALTTHKVKDSKIVHEFTLHIYKQAMKVFENIKQKYNDEESKTRVAALAKSYQQKFTDFVQRTREYNVRTGLGDQKVVLNTIDTSILILQRLINFLKSESTPVEHDEDSMAEANANTDQGVSDDVLQKEVDAEKEQEYRHVCVKYNYCRSAFGLKHVFQNVIKTMATASDDKLIQAVDAITEVLKAADFKRILDSRSETVFKRKIDRFEKTSPEHARLAINILLDALTNLNAPIEVAPENAAIAMKTTAFYNIVNELDTAIPSNDKNRLEWDDVEKGLQQWSNGERSDIQDILQSLMNSINRGIKDMSPESALKIRNQFNTH